MQTFLRLTLLGTFAAIGVGMAVAVALRGEPRADSWVGPAELDPRGADAQQAATPPLAQTPEPPGLFEPPVGERLETAFTPDTNPASSISASDPVSFAANEASEIQLVAAIEQESPPAPDPVPPAPRPTPLRFIRSTPLRPPVAGQFEDAEPPPSRPSIRSVPKVAPFEEDEESLRARAEPLPAPALASPEPAVAEVHKNEADGTVTINLQNAELQHVLRLLSASGTNILAGKNVQGTVSASVSNVDVEAALKAILQSTGFQSRREGKFVYVGTPQDFIEMEQLKDKIGTRIYRTNYVRASDLQALITPMLTERVSKITVSSPAEMDISPSTTHTGGNSFAVEEVIMVRDYEAVLAQVDQIVEEVDRRPQQVAIEAMILSVKLDDSLTCGVDFSALRGANNAALFSGSPLSTLGAVDITKGGLKFGFLDASVGNFITALETVGDTTVIASPKLMCLNKQRAEILIGQQLGYINSTVTETSTSQAVQFLEVGTQLRIRPFISRDGMVRMEVHPELSTGSVRVVGAFTLPDKVVTQVTTNIMCRDGCAVVIGGLIRKDLGQNVNQIPWLGNLPVAGAMFRRKNETDARNEIIVVITPRIVSEPELSVAGAQAAGEQLHRQAVYADQMSPIGKRHYARTRLRQAQEAWAAGKTKAALRNVKLAIEFDPLNLDAIHLRDEITGAATWNEADTIVDDQPAVPVPATQQEPLPLRGPSAQPAAQPIKQTKFAPPAATKKPPTKK